MNARLTRFYERDDWKQRLKAAQDVQPLLLERGISLHLKPLEAVASSTLVIIDETQTAPKPTLELAASALMAKVAAEAQQRSGSKVQAVSTNEMRRLREQRMAKMKEMAS